MADQVQALAIESWTLYAVAILFVAARLYALFHAYSKTTRRVLTIASRASRRILFGSLKKLRLDDYIMLFVVVRCYPVS